MRKTAVIMGSDSDWGVMQKAVAVLKEFHAPFEVHVFSAHRTPAEAADFASHAEENGFGVIIAGAGMSAALGGALAAETVLPIIGVPLKSAALEGTDALLSTAMMPPGIPVGCMAIDGAKNAAYYALEILALEDASLRQALKDYRVQMHDQVLQKDALMQEKVKEL